MKKDNINQLFENLKDEFDLEVPNLGHQERFLSKLNSTDINTVDPSFKFWKPLVAIAATLVLCFSLITILNQQTGTTGLASVSQEMSKTQDFFTSTIEKELDNLNKVRTPETKMLIDDALEQLKILEKDYESLKKDLTESGDDKRVIYAMISNYQNRINVLQTVMERIDDVKQLKQMTL
jgi:septal ring factor EnvC (AmiA/AmiB activator)